MTKKVVRKRKVILAITHINLLFTWRQRYSHLLPDEIQRTINKPAPVLPVVVSDWNTIVKCYLEK